MQKSKNSNEKSKFFLFSYKLISHSIILYVTVTFIFASHNFWPFRNDIVKPLNT